MNLSEKLAALTTHCEALRAERPNKPEWIVIRRPKQILGLIPSMQFVGEILVVGNQDCWRVMVNENSKNRNGPFLGGDFRKDDATRDGAWKWTTDGGWKPVWEDTNEKTIMRKIEDLIDLAVKILPATQL